jgi:hypothetical protein
MVFQVAVSSNQHIYVAMVSKDRKQVSGSQYFHPGIV